MSELADKLISLIEGGDPHMDGSTTQPWPKYVDRPGQVSVVMPGVVQGIIYDAAAELRRLEQWKSEALIVLAEWGRVHEALGSPGELADRAEHVTGRSSITIPSKIEQLLQRFENWVDQMHTIAMELDQKNVIRPTEIKIGVHTIHVVWDETKLKQSAEQNQMDPDTIMGQYVSTQNSIYITPIKNGENLNRDTLLHEILHAITHLKGVPVHDEENMIRTLTPALIEFVTQNPEVVEYVFATNRE